MAELAVIMSMITVTGTATSILGVIKRRCGASQAIVKLASKCAELVQRVQELLKTLEGGAQVPHNTRGISTALNHRREEFNVVLQNLEKMNRRTRRTHPIDRTEKFIMAQGWAKKMEAIHSDLINLRIGIENIILNWDVAQFVVEKLERIVMIDCTKEKRRASQTKGQEEQSETKKIANESVSYVDRYLSTMVQLTDANKEALNRYGNLDKVSLPDALYRASFWADYIDGACKIQLLERSAELLHPNANYDLGMNYQTGFRVKKNSDSAVIHFQIASSRRHVYSIFQLLEHYHSENDRESILKYIKMGNNMAMEWHDWIRYVEFAIAYGFESSQLVQPYGRASQFDHALQRSICHFFGVGAAKSNQKAADALQVFDSASYYASLEFESLSRIFIPRFRYFSYYRKITSTSNFDTTGIRNYADFLFEQNQFIPFLFFSKGSKIYSPRRWERYVLHAASSRCVDAHIFLVHHYSRYAHLNERKIKQHVRIAADIGHPNAQAMCRWLFGTNASVCKGLQIQEDMDEATDGKEKHHSRTKQSPKNKENFRYRKTARTRKKRGNAVK